jgi:hypothetical protein
MKAHLRLGEWPSQDRTLKSGAKTKGVDHADVSALLIENKDGSGPFERQRAVRRPIWGCLQRIRNEPRRKDQREYEDRYEARV